MVYNNFHKRIKFELMSDINRRHQCSKSKSSESNFGKEGVFKAIASTNHSNTSPQTNKNNSRILDSD